MTSPAPLARVYVAAPCGEAHVANMLRALLDRAGFRVVSQWTDRLRKQSARPSREEMRAIHRANCAELDDADLVVAWTAAGTPRATYCEIAHALAKGKPVLWLQGPRGEGSNSYDTEPLVRVIVVDLGETRMERDAAIVTAVREMAAGLCSRPPEPPVGDLMRFESSVRFAGKAVKRGEMDHAVRTLRAEAEMWDEGDSLRDALDALADALDALARAATSGARVVTLGTPRWGEPADSGAPTCRAHGCHAPPGEPCRERCIHLADKGATL